MKRLFNLYWAILFSVLTSIFSISCKRSEEAKRETVFDAIVHIEKELVTEIPPVSRYCDTLDLDKQRINVGDCELYCEEEGKGTPLVIVHGGPGMAHHFYHPVFSRAKDFCKVIYYDQRGVGLSNYARREGYTIDQAAGDLEKLRQGLNIDDWVVLGSSAGGRLAQYYVTRFPDHVKGLILVAAETGMHAPLKPARHRDYVSEEEKKRLREIREEIAELTKEKNLPYERALQLLIFNNFINGYWKRQNLYKPSQEYIAKLVLLDWKHDFNYYRQDIIPSMDRIELEGAFEQCPIPTLIMEGKWDWSWNTDKPEVFRRNHPGSQLVIFNNSGHSPFEDEPDKFFNELRQFIENLPEVSEQGISSWKDYLESWRSEAERRPSYTLRISGNDQSDSEKIAALYGVNWLEQPDVQAYLLRLGFALYDVKRYGEALNVFKKMEDVERKIGDTLSLAVAMIWKGHMLDLTGKREEALSIYELAAGLNVRDIVQHAQYGLNYEPSQYAAERMKEPFRRVENRTNELNRLYR